MAHSSQILAVVPVLVGPLQVLLALLPALLVSLGGIFLALLKPATFKKALKLLWRLKLPVLIIVGIIFGLVWSVHAMFPGQKGKISAAEKSVADWPAFRGGAQRAGAVPGCEPPVQGGINWGFSSEVKTFYSSPAVVGNRIYVSSADKGVFADRGAIYCLDADTGGVVWKSAPSGFRATFSSPAVSGKYLVCGEGLHFTRDGRVVCLDVTQNGKLLWEYRTKSHVESSPCISNGRAYIGAGDDGYYCFELEPDSSGKPRLVWHAPGGKVPDAETSPVVHEGKLYAGLGLGGRALVCLDAATGRELWRVSTPYPVFTPPTIAGQKVYFGMGNGNFIETAAEAAPKELEKMRKAGATAAQLAEAEKNLRAAGEVWAVDLRQPNTVSWRYRLSEVVLGAVVADADRVYFGSCDGGLYCLSQTTGKENGKYNAHTPIVTSPALTEKYVYFVTTTGKLIALSKETFQPVWETTLGSQGPFLSSPAIARGRVYVGTQNDGFLCVGTPGGGKAKPVWAGFLGGPGKPGSLELASLPDRGALLWRWPKPAEDSASETQAPLISAPAAVLDKILCVPVAQGPKKGLLCLTNAADAKQTPPELWFYETTNGVRLSPAMAYAPIKTETKQATNPPGLSVFIVDGVSGEARRHLHRVRAGDGVGAWKHPVSAEASGEFVLIQGAGIESEAEAALLIHDQPNSLACLTWADQVCWRQEFGKILSTPAVQNSLGVVALANEPTAVAFDLPTGRELWRVAIAATTGAVIEGSRVCVGTTNGVVALSLVSGSRIWTSDTGSPVHPLVCVNNMIAYANGREVIVLDARNGKTLARIPQVEAALPPLLCRESVIYATKESLVSYNVASAKAQRWMSTGWLGSFTSPLIIDDSSVYFATDKKGLVRAGKR